MSADWFYAQDGKAVGPLTLDALVTALRASAAPGDVQVWRADFAGWLPAREVADVAAAIARPEAPAQPRPARKRRWIAFLIVALAVLAGGAFLSTAIYDNSPDGMGYLFGQLVGVAALAGLLSIPWRKSTYTPAVVLAVAALAVGFGNSKKLAESFEGQRARAALKTVADRQNPEQALQQDPSNSLLKLTAEAYRVAQETVRLAEKLSDDIEPAALSGDIDIMTASRDALESYRAALTTAAGNAEAAMPRYLSLLLDERTRIEQLARALNLSQGVIREVLAGVDRRHGKTRDITAKMMDARRDAYRSMAELVSILIAESGNYSTDAERKLSFQNPDAVARYNSAAQALAAAVARVQSVDAERQEFVRTQQEGWDRFMSGQKTATD